MRRLRSMFSSQERKTVPTLSQEEEEQQRPNTAGAQSMDDSWTSIVESDLFGPPNAATTTWFDDANKWTTSAEFASDPTAWELELERSWAKLEALISKGRMDKDILAKVHEHLTSICKLLVMEVNAQSEPSIGPILEQFFNNEILLLVQKWALKVPQPQIQRCQMMLIRIYENMVTCCQCPQSLLVHKPILIPLLQLLQWCRKTTDERLSIQKVPKYLATTVDRFFVRLINQICRKIAEDETLLHFFFHSSVSTPRSGSQEEMDITTTEEESMDEKQEEQQHKPFLIFDLLVPYVYAPEDVGQLARDALLLIMSASNRHQFVADYVVQKSDFCHVLAGGLSACFSQLPKCVFTKLGLDPEESHKLKVADVKAVPQLYEFHNALLFANSVAQVAHADIVRQIAQFIYTGFLLRVFKTSILESEPKEDELCSRIVFFHLCVDTISSPALLHSFIKVLLADGDGERLEDDFNLLEVLMLKMQDTERLCRVTLSLVRTLLDLRCEDLLWCTVFRHLIPFIPLKTRTQSRRFNANISLNAAKFYLKCIPDCARQILELCSEEQFEAYLRETGETVREFERSCACWKLKYDGNMPNILLQTLSSASDELLSARQPFTRLSSARSSFASTGWNRYGHSNRSRHGTLLAADDDGSLDVLTNLNELGQEDEPIREEDLLNQLDIGTLTSSQEDFSDRSPELANDPRLDYFQFAYEGVSESDPESCSRRNSEEESQEENAQNGRRNILQNDMNGSRSNISQPYSARPTGSVVSGTDIRQSQKSPVTEAIFRTDWSLTSKGRDHFIALLDAIPMPKNSQQRRPKTMEENIALIDARWQYLEELRREKAESARRSESEPNPFRLDLNSNNDDEEGGNEGEKTKEDMKDNNGNGGGSFPMIATDEKGAGVLLESLFDVLSRMPEFNFATNMQLIGVLNTLFSYPQPLMTTYLLYVDSLRSKALMRITDLLNKVKIQIDGFAESIGQDEFEQLIRRGLRHRLAQAELYERRIQQQQQRSRGIQLEEGAISARSVRGMGLGGGFFQATAATMKDRDSSQQRQRDEPQKSPPSARRNNFAYAAIVHSQLCQLMAAYALQHSPPAINPQQQNGTLMNGGSLSSRMR